MIRRLVSLAVVLAAVAWLATHPLSEDWHEIVALGLWVQHLGAALVAHVLGRGASPPSNPPART